MVFFFELCNFFHNNFLGGYFIGSLVEKSILLIIG